LFKKDNLIVGLESAIKIKKRNSLQANI